jgi:predicted outer membrane protein
MSVSPVTTNTPVDHTQYPPSNKQLAANVKDQNVTPQDSVTLSSAAKSQQKPSGDLDRDGDSK